MQTIATNNPKLFPVKTIGKTMFIDFAHIVYVKAAGRHTLVQMKGEQEMIRSTLSFSAIEEMLPSSFFFKCHRSCIINMAHLHHFDKSSRKICLAEKHFVVLSKERIKEFETRTNIAVWKNIQFFCRFMTQNGWFMT